MKKGFTILELLVVISVLVILLGIAIPRFKGTQDLGKIAKVKAELKTMQTAVESYYLHLNPHAFPTTSTTVGNSFLGVSTPQIVSTTPPFDPFGATETTEYNYKVSDNGRYYVIWSVGVDGVNATTAISDAGAVTTGGDDKCVTNGTGCTGS